MNTKLPEIEHHPIYWKDGMLVSCKELIDSDNATLELIRDSRAGNINNFNYGLLAGDSDEPDNYPHIEYSNVDKMCVVKLLSCRAITKGGCRIEITVDSLKKQIPLKAPSVQVYLTENCTYDIFISVMPMEKRQEAGKEVQSSPPGRRFSSVTYELSAIRRNSFDNSEENGLYSLKLGELVIDNGVARLNREYIPSCMAMGSHPLLLEEHKNILSDIRQIEEYCIKIFQKFRPERKGSLANEVLFIFEKLINYLSSSFNSFKIISKSQPPFQTIAFIINIAKTLDVALECSEYQKYIAKTYPRIKEVKESTESYLYEIESVNHSEIQIALGKTKRYINDLKDFLAELANEGRVVRGGRR